MSTELLDAVSTRMDGLLRLMEKHVAPEMLRTAEWTYQLDELIMAYAATVTVFEHVERGEQYTRNLIMQVEHNEKRAAMPWWRFW